MKLGILMQGRIQDCAHVSKSAYNGQTVGTGFKTKNGEKQAAYVPHTEQG